MLTDVENAKSALLDLGYGDCVAFEPAACGTSYYLSEFSTCDRNAFTFDGEIAPVARRGAVVVQDEPGQPDYSVYTGDTVVQLTGVSADRVDRVLAQLRPVEATGPPPALPTPAVPARIRRFLDRAGSAYRRLHTFRAVARKLHIPRVKARSAVEFAAVLDRLGPRRTARCSASTR